MILSDLVGFFYKNVKDSRLSYKISDYKNISNGIQYQLNKVDEYTVELLQDNCPTKLLDCSDMDFKNIIDYPEKHCVSMTVQCGYPSREEFTLDGITDFGSEVVTNMEDILQAQINVVENAGNLFKNLASSFYNGASNSIASFYNVLEQIGGEKTHLLDFSKSTFELVNPVNIYMDHIPGMMKYFFNNEPSVQCDWSDLGCHKQILSEKINEICSQDEGMVNYLKCVLESGIEHISQYDAQEVFNDIKENYLPEDTVPYLAIASVCAATLFISVKHMRNNMRPTDPQEEQEQQQEQVVPENQRPR